MHELDNHLHKMIHFLLDHDQKVQSKACFVH